MDEELAPLCELLHAADLPAGDRQAALWCVHQLPRLYQELSRTYEARYEDEIRRLAGAALLKVAGTPAEGAAREHLLELHRRLGFGVLTLPSPPTPARSPSRRPRKGR